VQASGACRRLGADAQSAVRFSHLGGWHTLRASCHKKGPSSGGLGDHTGWLRQRFDSAQPALSPSADLSGLQWFAGIRG